MTTVYFVVTTLEVPCCVTKGFYQRLYFFYFIRSCLFLSGRKFVLGKSKKNTKTRLISRIFLILDPKLGLHMDFIVLLHTALLIFSLLEQFLSNESFSFFSLKMLLKSSYHTPCIIT